MTQQYNDIWPEDDSMVVAWPCWMPVPEPASYSYENIDVSTYSKMEIGGIKRRNFDVDAANIQCKMTLDQCQVAFLEALENDLLQQGQVWFRMPLLLGGQIADYKVRFASRPKIAGIRATFTEVTFSLYVGRKMLTPWVFPTVEEHDLPVWPSELPNLLQSGYGYELADNTLSGNSNLPTRKRVEFLQIDEATVTGTLWLTYPQLHIFTLFERDVLRNGVRWFKLPLWISGDRLPYKVRFLEPPSVSFTSGTYASVSFSLEMSERELLDPYVVILLLTFSPDELFVFSEKLHYALHVVAKGSTWVPEDVYVRII